MRQVELAPPESLKDRGRQLEALEKMATTLEQGSSSLNQRATTLAALAVAALGAFGVFSSRIGEIDPHLLSIFAAILVGISSFTLLAAAAFALTAVLPAGNWTASFAQRLEPVAQGELNAELHSRHLLAAMKAQLERNHQKAMLMNKAYRLTGGALLAATLAVVMALAGVVV